MNINIPSFNPDTQCISMTTSKKKTQFHVVNERSKDKRIASNMKVAQFVSDHLEKVNVDSPGFESLIASIATTFGKGKFTTNSDFVISALKTLKANKHDIHGIALNEALYRNEKVMVTAIQVANVYINHCDKTLLNDDNFINKCLKEDRGLKKDINLKEDEILLFLFYNHFEKIFKDNPNIAVDHIMNWLKDFDNDAIQKKITFLEKGGKKIQSKTLITIAKALKSKLAEKQENEKARYGNKALNFKNKDTGFDFK